MIAIEGVESLEVVEQVGIGDEPAILPNGRDVALDGMVDLPLGAAVRRVKRTLVVAGALASGRGEDSSCNVSCLVLLHTATVQQKKGDVKTVVEVPSTELGC